MLSGIGSSLGGLSVVDGLGRPLLSGPLEGSPELRLQVGERVESCGSEKSAGWFRASCRQLGPGCPLVDRVVVMVAVPVAMGTAGLVEDGCGKLTNTWHFGG